MGLTQACPQQPTSAAPDSTDHCKRTGSLHLALVLLLLAAEFVSRLTSSFIWVSGLPLVGLAETH